jgi:hypothetical protein
MVDWNFRDPLTSRMRTVRLELEPIFCFNCGAPNGYVPRGIMSFVSWLCEKCSLTWGELASLHKHADQDFWDKVTFELNSRFGRSLTQQEISMLAERGKLGSALEKLEKESPYKLFQG